MGPVVEVAVEHMVLLTQGFDRPVPRLGILPLLDKLSEQRLVILVGVLPKASQLTLAVIPDHCLEINKVWGLPFGVLIRRPEVFTKEIRPVQRQSGPELFMSAENAVGQGSDPGVLEIQSLKSR
ncbi:hypothetical protein D3C72_649770 [compost metagenome]